MMFLGIDGCKGGWLGVSVNATNQITIAVYGDLKELLHHHHSLQNICIDMPMGLQESSDEIRACDPLIRQWIQ